MEQSVREYLDNPSKGEWAHCNNFFDWFCSDRALIAKQKSLDAKVRKLAKSSKIDTDKWYVWYKNNCPVCGHLFDDIRFADINTGEVIYNVVPKNGFNSRAGLAEVYGKENGFVEPLVSGTWGDVLDFFGVGKKK